MIAGTVSGYWWYLTAFGIVMSGSQIDNDLYQLVAGGEANASVTLGIQDAKATNPALKSFADYQTAITALAIPSS